MRDTRILVVHYSRTGNTRRVARAIAAALDADIEELADPMERQGAWGYCRCAIEALFGRTVRLQPPVHDPGAYDLVIVGTPVWFGRPSSVIRTFLVRYRERLPRVAFFLTHGGSARERVLDAMTALAGKRPEVRMAIRERDLRGGDYAGIIDRYVAALRDAVPAHV